MSGSSIIREAPVADGNKHRDAQPDKVQRVRDLEALYLKGSISGSSQEPGEGTDYKCQGHGGHQGNKALYRDHDIMCGASLG